MNIKIQHGAIRDLLFCPGFKVKALEFDISHITPRIRNRAIKRIEVGHMIGGGQAIKLVRNLDNLLDLQLSYSWGLNIKVGDSLTEENKDKLKAIIAADHTSYLLTSEKSHKSRSWYRPEDVAARTKEQYEKNIQAVNDSGFGKPHNNFSYRANEVVLWSEPNFDEIAKIVNESVSEEVKARRAKVVAALKNDDQVWTIELEGAKNDSSI